MNQQLVDRLRGIFLGELEDQLIVMNSDLLALEANPDDPARLKSLFRVAHTLKGAAASAGESDIAQTCHELETILAEVRDRGRQLGPEEFRILFSAADALADAGRRIRQEGEADAGASENEEPVSPSPAPDTAPRKKSELDTAAQDYLRIDPAMLDSLLASVEQLLVAIDSVGAHSAEGKAVSEELGKVAATTARAERNFLRANGSGATSALPNAALPSGQLLRSAEQSARLAALTAADMRVLRNTGNELADRARRLRMRPFREACEALPRVVRDVARDLSKDVRLQIDGDDVRADRVILDGLREALVHLVRNAIDHGIESKAMRTASGKPAEATITITAVVAGSSIRVTVEDDGAGLDTAAIRASARRLGKVIGDDDESIVAALLGGGLSTRSEATAISGRGVGLDLVRSAVERIQGSIDVAWEEGKGTRFTIEAPLTLATIRVLLVKVESETIALPTAHVERIRRISIDEIRTAQGREVITLGDAESGPPLRVMSLARLMGSPFVERPMQRDGTVVLLEAQGRHLALLVDEVLAEQVVIVRKLKGINASLPHVSGVAILSGGRIAPVANVIRLLADGIDAPSGLTMTAPAGTESQGRKRILVVDDSVTTRMLEQSMLEAAGYEVGTAVDGLQALEALSEDRWDLVVSDVEMPRMDGFGLCMAIRKSPRLRTTKVILVTALEKSEDRARGLDVGADAYIGKSSFDQRALLDTIHQLLGT